MLMSTLLDTGPTELAAPESNVRSRVHEYGGRPYVVLRDAVVYSEFVDQRLYACGNGEPLTAPGLRYADGACSVDGTLFMVREDHTHPGEPTNSIVRIGLDGGDDERVLFDRSDFVAYPRPSADGRLAFVSWNHPNMPWDATGLYVGRLGAEGLVELEVVAGGEGSQEESVLEPVWAEDGTLYFLSDRSGFWNLYRWRAGAVEPVLTIAADLGGPLWTLGASSYAVASNELALVRICRAAVDALAVIDLKTGSASELPLPQRAFSSIGIVDERTGFAVAAPDDAPPATRRSTCPTRSAVRSRSRTTPRMPGGPTTST